MVSDMTEQLPELEVERGTEFDWIAGDLIFPQALEPDAKGDVVVTEPREPSITDLQECLRVDGKAVNLERGLTLPIKSAEWSVSAPKHDSSALAGKIADEVHEMLTLPVTGGGMKISMQTVIAQATTAFWARRAYWECVYKREGSKLVYDKIGWRPPDTCRLLRDKNNADLQGFDQIILDHPDRVVIAPPYSFVFIHGKDRDPIKGHSDFEVVWRNYRTKQKIKFLWMTYLESSALPKIIAVTKANEGKRLANLVASVRNAGAVAIPANWLGDGTTSSIKTIDTSGQGNTDFRSALNWLDADSADSLLQGSLNASRAAATSAGPGMPGVTDSTNFFQKSLNAKADELASDITNTLIGRYVLFNYGPDAPVPVFEFEDLNPAYIEHAFQLLQNVSMAHQFNLPPHFVQELVFEIGREMGMNLDALEKSTQQWITKVQSEEQAALQTQGLRQTRTSDAMAKLEGTTNAGVAAVTAGQPVSPDGQPV